MWDLATIRAMNAEAALLAREREDKPYRLTSKDEVQAMGKFPFPNLGAACDDWDDTYTRLDSLFVDHSGWGRPGEPALTIEEFRDRLCELLDDHPVLYAAIEEVGPFQLFVALWAGSASS